MSGWRALGRGPDRPRKSANALAASAVFVLGPVSGVLDQNATAALVVRAQRGDSTAFAALARAFLRAAYSVALAVVARPADAEDVAQDALVAALEKIGACREPERFAGWLLTIVRNRARNLLESRRLRDVVADEPRETSVDQGSGLEHVGLRAQLLAALALLNDVQREVVLLHDLEDWTHADIALALGMSELMSRQHLFQARRVLRERLHEQAPAEVKHGR